MAYVSRAQWRANGYAARPPLRTVTTGDFVRDVKSLGRMSVSAEVRAANLAGFPEAAYGYRAAAALGGTGLDAVSAQTAIRILGRVAGGFLAALGPLGLALDVINYGSWLLEVANTKVAYNPIYDHRPDGTLWVNAGLNIKFQAGGVMPAPPAGQSTAGQLWNRVWPAGTWGANGWGFYRTKLYDIPGTVNSVYEYQGMYVGPQTVVKPFEYVFPDPVAEPRPNRRLRRAARQVSQRSLRLKPRNVAVNFGPRGRIRSDGRNGKGPPRNGERERKYSFAKGASPAVNAIWEMVTKSYGAYTEWGEQVDIFYKATGGKGGRYVSRSKKFEWIVAHTADFDVGLFVKLEIDNWLEDYAFGKIGQLAKKSMQMAGIQKGLSFGGYYGQATPVL